MEILKEVPFVESDQLKEFEDDIYQGYSIGNRVICI